MKFASPKALALCAAFLASSAIAQNNGQAAAAATATAQPQVKVSSEAGPAIVALQTAVKAKDAANIPAKLEAAKAKAKSPDDKYAIGMLALEAAVDAKDYEAASTAADYVAASGFAGGQNLPQLYTQLGVEFLRAKNYPRATALFTKALALDPNNSDAMVMLGEAQNGAGDQAGAIQTMQKALMLGVSSGKKASEDVYKRATTLAYAGQSPMAVQIGREWIAAYPSADSWHNGVAIYRNMMHPEVEGTLDLLRLLMATDGMSTSGDYTLLASAAAEQGNYAEAQAALDAGVAAGKVDLKTGLAKDIAAGLKGKAKPTAADLASAEKSATTGKAKATVANRYYGTGDYAKAAELYRAALAAGNDADLTNLRLGMSLARAGDKAGAAAALKAVGGAYKDIAAYWLIYVS